MRPAATTRPVLALSGDMPRKMHGTDFIQTTKPDLLFRDVSLYTETISSPGAGAGRDSPGDRRGLCRPRRRAPDGAAGRHGAEGRGRVSQRRDPAAAQRDRASAKPTSPRSPDGSTRPTAW